MGLAHLDDDDHLLYIDDTAAAAAAYSFCLQNFSSCYCCSTTHSTMAFLLNKATTFSRFQSSSSQKTSDEFLQQSRRRFHIEPGAREKALLEEDPALKRFKSHKKSVYRLKRVGDVLTIVVVAGCCYEIYVRAVMREEARKQAKTTTEGA